MTVPRQATAAAGRPHRVIFVVNDAPFFLSHRLPLAEGARRAGYEVHIATPDHPARWAIMEQGFEFHPIPMSRSGAGLVGEFRTLRALFGLYRALQPDLVHHVTHKPVLYGSVAARVLGVPAVVNAVSGLGYAFIAEGAVAEVRRRLMLALYRVALGHPNSGVIFQNPDDVALFRAAKALSGARVVLIPGSGVDLDQFYPVPEPEGCPVIVLPARMLWDKGVGDFVEAIRILKGRGVEVRALLVGDPDPGNPRSVDRERLIGWAREGIVEWLGHQTDMPRVLAHCHIVCLPSSYREGVPKTLLEAAAAGRPVVTTDVPGCRDVVRDGENGLVVPPREPALLAQALEALLGDRTLRLQFGASNRARAVVEFGVDRVVEGTIDLYRELLPSRVPGPRAMHLRPDPRPRPSAREGESV
jgi:glycosyltransferase involved in cell wall biosynthesis